VAGAVEGKRCCCIAMPTNISTTYMRKTMAAEARPPDSPFATGGGLADGRETRVRYQRFGRGKLPASAPYDAQHETLLAVLEVAEKGSLELCLDRQGNGSEERVNLDEVDGLVWHAILAHVTPGSALRLPGTTAMGPGGGAIDRSRAKAATGPYGQVVSGDFEFTQAL